MLTQSFTRCKQTFRRPPWVANVRGQLLGQLIVQLLYFSYPIISYSAFILRERFGHRHQVLTENFLRCPACFCHGCSNLQTPCLFCLLACPCGVGSAPAWDDRVVSLWLSVKSLLSPCKCFSPSVAELIDGIGHARSPSEANTR